MQHRIPTEVEPVNPAQEARATLGAMRRPTTRVLARRWPLEHGPLALLLQRREYVDRRRRPRWVDHARVECESDGTIAYVAEPYELTEEAFADLALLEDFGYEVEVTASKAQHLPGQTLHVRITGGEPS